MPLPRRTRFVVRQHHFLGSELPAGLENRGASNLNKWFPKVNLDLLQTQEIHPKSYTSYVSFFNVSPESCQAIGVLSSLCPGPRSQTFGLECCEGRCCPGCCPRVARVLNFWPRVWCYSYYFSCQGGCFTTHKDHIMTFNDVPKGSAAAVEDQASWVSHFASL